MAKSTRSTARHQKAERFGRFAETIAGLWLRLKGYHIIARRFRSRAGEIDLVLRRGRVLVFAEVKARKSTPKANSQASDLINQQVNTAAGLSGAEVLTLEQRNRIVRAAEAYVQNHPELSSLDWRFDLILVRRPFGLRHLTDAWRPGMP